MTTERYWVIGGDYSSMSFKTLKGDAPQVLGPYDTRDEATAVWKQVSGETRAVATTRFAIASEQFVRPA